MIPNGTEFTLYVCKKNLSDSMIPYLVRSNYKITSNASHLESGTLYINGSNDYYHARYEVPIKNYTIFGSGISTLTVIVLVFTVGCLCFCFYVWIRKQ